MFWIRINHTLGLIQLGKTKTTFEGTVEVQVHTSIHFHLTRSMSDAQRYP